MTQGNCPKCGSNDLDYETICDTTPGDECIYYPFTCGNCDFSGREYYNLHFTGYEDNDGNEVGEQEKDYCEKGNGCKHLGENTCANSAPNNCYEERTK